MQVVDHGRNISGSLGATALITLFILSCAKISSPSGGPRDTDPPVILRSQPENGTVLFSGRSFAVTFNEYVVLDRISEKFMVSPPLAKKPDIRLKGKSLLVSWDEELADSTTYTFYFQDAIRDNNEANPIPNYQYVFSTGPVLDSLSLTGNVFSANDLEIVEDVTVLMYSNLSDTAPRKLLPAYISRPDPSGGFMISNIRPGRYRLYALKDLNGNRRYDLDDEIFAFCDSVINITPEDYYNLTPDTVKFRPPAATETAKPDLFVFGLHRLYVFQQESKKQYLRYSDRRSAWSIGFGLALPSDSGQVSITLADTPPESWFLENNRARDTFMLWITQQEIYERDMIEGILTYPFTDSTGTVIARTDTLSFRYTRPAIPRGGAGRIPALSVSTNLTGRIRPGTEPLFTAAVPLLDPDTSLITLIQTVDSVRTELAYDFVRDSMNSRRIVIRASLVPGGSYSLVCLRGAFRDLYGNATDSTNYRFSVAREDDYGSLKVSLSGYNGDIIVQLVGERERVVREAFVKSPGDVIFPLLDKGKYRLKAIYDLDANRVWTTGDFRILRSPEPVTYYPGELEVKINWSLEQNWDIGEMYKKDVSIRNKPAIRR